MQIHWVVVDPAGTCTPAFETINVGTGNQMACINTGGGFVWTSINGGGGGVITGGGTASFLPIWVSGTGLGDSSLQDNGATVSTTENITTGQSGTQGCLGLYDASTNETLHCGGGFNGTITDPSTLGSNNGTQFLTVNSGVESFTSPAAGGAAAGFGMWQLTVPTWSTWLNQGGATSVSGKNFISILAPAGSGQNLRVLHGACNGGNAWTDWYVLAVVGAKAISSNPFAGIEIDDGTKLIVMGTNYNGASSTIGGNTLTSATSSYSGLASDGLNASAIGVQIWYHVTNLGSNTFNLDYSFDGVGVPGTSGGWARLNAGVASGLSAVTNCGAFVNANSSNTADITILSSSFATLVAQ